MDLNFLMSQEQQGVMSFEQRLVWLIRGAFAAAGAFWAGLDAAMQLLIILATLDYVSGVAAAYKNGTWSSSTGKKGITKKGLMFLVVCAVYAVQAYMPFDVPFNAGSAICGFYSVNELISILENGVAGGLKLPPWLVTALEKAGELKQTLNTGGNPIGNAVHQVSDNGAESK